MKGRLSVRFALLALIMLGMSGCNTRPSAESAGIVNYFKGNMKISSSAFDHNTDIPREFTCQGDNISPPLAIDQLPAGTRSLVLIVDDPDAPGGNWDHWLVWNIDPAVAAIEKNSVPPGAVQGQNGRGRNDYGGPCPPQGKHRYYFKLHALSERLDLPAGSKKQDLLNAMEGKILEQATLIGLYQKS